MKPAQEIEIKFAAPPELSRLQHQLPAKAIRTAKPKSLVSVYFDTDKLKLHKHGLTLRVRRDGEQRLQTVKVENGQALTARGEWERAIQSDQPDFKAVQGTPAERILRKRKIRGTIKPIFETRVTRTTCPVKIGRSLIEVAFDPCRCCAGVIPKACIRRALPCGALRAAISLFVELLHDDGTQAIKNELKWVMGEFGPAREMDVLTKSLATASDVQFRSHGSPRELEALGMELEGKRRRAFQRAQAAVEATRFRMLLVDLVAWIDAGDWLTTDGPTARVERARPIIEFAAEQLERRWKKILKRGRKLRELDPQRRHKLRIQVKKTRYAAEFFAGAFSSRKARRRGKAFQSAASI
jgi:inorganic triphosphatase YgiF